MDNRKRGPSLRAMIGHGRIVAAPGAYDALSALHE